MQTLSEPGAVCRVHPGVSAAFICTRCGSFTCEQCQSASSPGRCQSCAAHEGPGLGRELSALGLLRDSFRLLAANLPAVGVVAAFSWVLIPLLAFVVAPGRGSSAETRPDARTVLAGLLIILVRLAISVGFIQWVADGLLPDRQRALKSALSSALVSTLFFTLMCVIFGLVVGIGSVLLIVPGVYLAVCMSLAPAALVVDGHGPLSALNHSYAIVKGHRLQLFLMLLALILLQWVSGFMGGVASALLGPAGAAGSRVGNVIEAALTLLSNCLLEISLVLAYLRITRRPAPEPPPLPVPATAASAPV